MRTYTWRMRWMLATHEGGDAKCEASGIIAPAGSAPKSKGSGLRAPRSISKGCQ